MLIDREDWIKGMKVGKLRELISQLDDSLFLICHPVSRNLAIWNENLETVGYIDFLDDTLRIFGKEEENK